MRQAIDYRELLVRFVQASDDAIMTKALDGTVLTWNPAATRVFGYSAEEMIGQKMLKLFPPDKAHEEDAILAKLAAGERINHFRTQRLHKAGHTIDISVTLSPMHDTDGRVVAASKVARDITEQVKAEQQVAQFKALIDSSDDAIISKDTQGVIRTWNAGATRIFGYSAQEAVGQNINMLFPPERLHEEEKLIQTVLAGEAVRHFRTTRLTKDGQRIFASVSVSAIKNEAGQVIGFSKIVRDLTQEIQQEQLLWQTVHFDSLTGMMNRVGIQNAVDDLIKISHVRNRAIAVVQCDLKGFAQINARLSTKVGDQVLMEVAQALRGAVREADDIARTHADHFVVLLQGFTHASSIPKAVAKIQAAVESVTSVAGHPLALTASLGVAVYPEDGKTYASLIKSATHAAHTAKFKSGGGGAVFLTHRAGRCARRFLCGAVAQPSGGGPATAPGVPTHRRCADRACGEGRGPVALGTPRTGAGIAHRVHSAGRKIRHRPPPQPMGAEAGHARPGPLDRSVWTGLSGQREPVVTRFSRL